jgi:uncharacterized protein (TIGR02266 family)
VPGRGLSTFGAGVGASKRALDTPVLSQVCFAVAMSEEHRRFTRKTVQVDFRCRDASGAGELLFEAADLSLGGSFLKSELLLEPGETLVLEFSLPGDERLLKAHARVAWVRRFPKDGEMPGMGVEFLGMAQEDRAALEDVLGSLG